MKDRIEKILSRVRKEHKILELGPSYNPAITRAEGWNVYSLDHASAEELRKKYGSNPVADVSRIQEVDFIWKDGPLESAIPEEHLGTFDIVIASHVIEHQPDLVSFFQSVGKMLKPDGLLSLAVPDKRFCFDYFMPLSLTGDVLEAFSERRTRHANKSLYNGTAYHALADGAIVWFQLPIGRLSFISGDVTEAGRFFDSHPAVGNSKYVDTHAWYFTPSSFRLVIHELQLLKLVDFAEEDYFPPVDVEFFISLRRGGANPAKSRMELLKQMLLEVREQTDFLVRSRAEWPQPNQQCPDRELELERELASLKEMNRRMAQEIDRWNHKPWYSRAIHKIRLRAP